MYRYLALVWNARSLEGARMSQSFAAAAASSSKWLPAYDGPGIYIIHRGLQQGATAACPLKAGKGVVIGTVFSSIHEQPCRRVTDFDEAESSRIVDTGGQRVVDGYWGAYAAFLHDVAREQHHVFRDPTGGLPCYHLTLKEVEVFFSHIEDCVDLLPVSLLVNRNYLVRWLLVGRLIGRECGLEGVEDLPGGERVTLCRGKTTRTFLWKPVELAQAPLYVPPEQAAAALRSTLQGVVNAWASCYTRIGHELSGGLDSSIVAGCLAQAPTRPNITCLNFSISVGFDEERLHLPGLDKRMAAKVRAIAGHGDERYFARLVAERWKFPLVEQERAKTIDLSRVRETPLMLSPAGYVAVVDIDDAEIAFVSSYGLQALFSGNAGDSVLLATLQPLGAIDYAHLHGIGPGLWNQILDTATLSRESVWTVARKVFTHGLLRRPYRRPFSILDQPTLVRKELRAGLSDDDFTGLWALRGSTLPPGKQDHIRGLAGSAHHDTVYHSEKYCAHVEPLNAQPVWEILLRTPTYTLLTGGVSRGLARKAFADLLPDEVRKRQVKGTGAPLCQHVVRQNRQLLKEILLDGLLVTQGYLDREKLEKVLSTDEPFLTIGGPEILSYLVAEIWLQQWAHPKREHETSRGALRALGR